MESDFSKDDLREFRRMSGVEARADVNNLFPVGEFSIAVREREFSKRAGIKYRRYTGDDINPHQGDRLWKGY